MSADIFLDTNVFVYAFDASAPEKRRQALAIINDDSAGEWTVSWQVVQEFSSTALHRFKIPMRPTDLAAYLEVVLWPRCSLFPSPAIYRHALKIHQEMQYRFFDSLIVASALATGAKVLYTEDLEHGREIRNLRIQNPFLPQKT